MRIDLEGGGQAELVDCDVDSAVFASSRPFPPGASLVGRHEGGANYTLKVRACRADGERFRVEGRFVNLSRLQRAEVLEAVGRGSRR